MSELEGKQRTSGGAKAPGGEGMMPSRNTKASATATIEPMGSRKAFPRNHSIKVAIRLSASDSQHADKEYLRDVARRALGGFRSTREEPDRREYRDLAITGEWKKSGSPSVVVGVEGAVVWPDRPTDPAVEQLRASLVADGYRVTVYEKRECAEGACSSVAVVAWNRPAQVPAGWYTHSVCGQHNYRACSRCGSTYTMTSSNSVGKASSVHCQVCGEVMVEWGSSKVWHAELISRGPGHA